MNRYVITILFYLMLTSFDIPNNGKVQTKWLTDSNGKKIKKERETQWNSRGDVVKSVEYIDGTEPLVMEFSYVYQAGRKVKQTDLRSHEFTVYTYDKSGRLIQEILYTAKKEIEEKKVHAYTQKGRNIIFTEAYDGKKLLTPYMRSTFEYYPNNLLKKEVQTVSGSWFSTRELQYDNKNHLIYEGEEADGGVGLVKHYYTYKGNVLVKDMVKVPDTGTAYYIYETKIH